MMLRFLVVTLLIGMGLAGSIVQRSDNDKQTPPQQQLQQSMTGQNLINDPVYLPSQQSQLQYQYPSYPEYSDSGYTTQSGSEGHLVPVTQSSPLPKLPFTTGLAMSLIPLASNIMTYGSQVGTYLLHFLLALAVGGAFITLICTFTPICSIGLMGLSLNQYGVKEQVADLARTYITPESVNAATVLVTRAIDKYNAMQREKREKSKQAKR